MAKRNSQSTSKERSEQELAQFKTSRIKTLQTLYADEISTNRRFDKTGGRRPKTYRDAAEVREALERGIQNPDDLIAKSKILYATNPIYASVIDYLSSMFMWRYKVTPHKVYTKSKAKARKEIKEEDYKQRYHLMLEIVEGLSIETKFPSLLAALFINGRLNVTTYCDEESLTVNTLILPEKYCRKVAETQYSTSMIQFDFSYFDSLGLKEQDLKDYFKSFPKEFIQDYNRYKKDNNLRWQTLDPHFSSGFYLNDYGLPTYMYILGGILDYEHYQDNEVERSDNSLKYLVVHTMPVYQDQLIFEVDEVAAVHQSLKRVVDTGEKARLITTYGDVHVENIGDDALAEADTLGKSFKAIFNNAGFNSGIFTSESVEALNMSLIRDKGIVWKHVQSLINFYNLVINNYFDFNGYQADIDILPISPYTYRDDIEVYRNNATLGVGKIDFLVASGVKQKHIEDTFELENFLHLERITPLQSSYTQTAGDREEEKEEETNDKEQDPKDQKDPKNPEIEPSEKKESEDPKNLDPKKESKSVK